MDLSYITPERIVVAIALTMAGIERFLNRKKEIKTQAEQDMVNDAKLFHDRAAMLQKLAEDNAQLYLAEREEHKGTRKYWHDKATEYQATLSNCQDKMAEIQARPDYSDIVEISKEQAKTCQMILQGIQEVVSLLKVELIKNKPLAIP